MNFKKSFFFVLLLILILGCSIVSATENTNSSSSLNLSNCDEYDGEISNENLEGSDISSKDDTEVYIQNESDSLEIYVGRNITYDGGNGSINNPFSTLDKACEKTNGEKNVTINIFNGTYTLCSPLIFNADNLTLNGLGNVTINTIPSGMNYMMSNYSGKLYLGLKSSSANFTVNNIVFNSSSYIGPSFFTSADYGTYNNCTFIGSMISYLHISSSVSYTPKQTNTKFLKCIFKNYSSYVLFEEPWRDLNSFVYFENCVMLDISVDSFVSYINIDRNFTLNGMWFGYNGIPDYVTSIQGIKSNGQWCFYDRNPVSRFAVFSVTENYLGDNKYEIIGRLTWNGTDVSVGASFAPMHVKLSSSTGYIQDNITLNNGVFRTVYVSNSSENSISCVLDNQIINLNFNTVDVNVDVPNIVYCGDGQNISIKFDYSINSVVNVNINDSNYEIKVKSSEVFFSIPNSLKEGIYDINVTLYDQNNHLYGFTTSKLKIIKVEDYNFASIIPADVKIGEIAPIIIELPDDADGNIDVKVNNNTFSNIASKYVVINITGLVLGDNDVTIIYSGNDKYVAKSISDIITAEKVEVELDNNTLNFNNLKGTTYLIFNITLSRDAIGNLTVMIDGKNYTRELVNGSSIIDVVELNPGDYIATVTYSGDSKYVSITKNVLVSVPKPVLTAKSFSMLYTSGAKYAVSVTLDGKAVAGKKVSFTINGKKVTANTDKNGYASVKISLPPKSKAYTVTATYLGVKVTNKVTVKSIVTANNVNVKKSAKILKIKVSLKKVNKKYLKGKTLSLKFKGKTYKAKTNKKGIATFTIKKNVLKKLKVGKKYTYKVTYGKDVVNKKITVKK